MSKKIIRFSFYILFLVTPLVFTPFNSELFEFNKMIFVYLITSLVTTAWILEMIAERRLLIKTTPLDIPLLLFLLSQILSTIFSIDPHTSVWGYYSRLNGGLLSIISYLLLYWAFVTHFTKDDLPKFLKFLLAGGLLVSLWAIPEHFGKSLSCQLLTGQFSADCWVQDVKARVFATLGQPNWLAAYLGMIIFPAIYLFLTAKTKLQTIIYFLLAIIYYLAFTFTFSRGGMVGFLTGLVVFTALTLTITIYSSNKVRSYKEIFSNQLTIPIILILLSFLVVNIYFGSALTKLKLEKTDVATRPGIITTSGTQLENGGTESGAIRLIVWKGALEIFKHYPILGSGTETFAYSYYQFRPREHNLVSEWDFLYNKAHNEYLNYLATTGLLGLLSYLAVIFTFIVWSIKRIMNLESKSKEKLNSNSLILISSLLAGYISYLVQNFFGFSVVLIAMLFYLFPAFSFVSANVAKDFALPKRFNFLTNLANSTIYKRSGYTKATTWIVIIFGIITIWNILNIWNADTFYKRGNDAVDTGNPGAGYRYLTQAAILNRNEPLYRADLGLAAAASAVGYSETDATLSAQLKEDALMQTNIALSKSPRNLSLYRTAVRTYYELSTIDKEYLSKTIEILDKAITFAPTDSKLYYNKALLLAQNNKVKEAIETLNKALELKPNYREPRLSLAEFLQKEKQFDKALEQVNIVLQQIPNDPDALALKEAIEKGK